MRNTMEYKGYIGSVEFSQEDFVFFGKVLGIRSLISYQGATAKELVEDFQGAIDEYLDICSERGEKPEKAFKGSLNIRLGGDLHRRAALYAISNGETINRFIETAVEEKLERVAT